MKLILGLILSTVVAKECEKTDVRKEIRDLSQEERRDFFDAILKLNSGSRPTRYDDIVRTHVDITKHIHSKPIFLPWHRYYIFKLQEELRTINPKIVIPYWDWSKDSQAPERSEIFRKDFFGGTGLPETNYCVPNGPFTDFDVLTTDDGPELHCLRRSFDDGTSISAFASPEVIEQIKKENPTFSSFTTNFERSPHALPHNNIGGGYGDFSQHSSPNDPLFWVHHGFVDKVWSEWQHDKGKKGFVYSENSLLSNMMNFNVSVHDIMDTRSYPLCYTYDSLSEAIPNKENSPSEDIPEENVPEETPNKENPPEEDALENVPGGIPPPIDGKLNPPEALRPKRKRKPKPIKRPRRVRPATRPQRRRPRRVRRRPQRVRRRPQRVRRRPRRVRRIRRARQTSPTSSFDRRNPMFIPFNVLNDITAPFLGTELFRRADMDFSNSADFNKLLDRACPKQLCPSASDRNNQNKLRIPKPVPAKWIHRNGIDLNQFRKEELKIAKILYSFNSNPNYVSKSSLRYWSSNHKSSSSSKSRSKKKKTTTTKTVKTVTTRRIVS